ncbi:TetR/AcrR family transcriptional regulator [Streptomyces sp. ms191]|uniref:TetR/AcrR family transcriptional regulator n=1 Tax=unclassified Streptomyces TaxID=2593676 RepID=UPI0011CDC19B|nr:TetR/AcrR family transcriptional regulator [Streptomyces sp. ms191]TXS30041.1 TetR/AcrR family transcriptional regulator [Streptomyces sp. ms191]
MTSRSSSYHHGDLRQAVLTAALDVIAAEGPAALSLRDLARRAGVSHAAPAHHFKDRTGLLTAIATEGYDLLARALADAPSLRERGVAYVRFALGHPAHFQVMFRPDLHRGDDPALLAAKERASAELRAGVTTLTAAGDARVAGIAAWSLAHGFATLFLTGNLTEAAEAVGTSGAPAGTGAPEDLFRDLTRLLFQGSSPSPGKTVAQPSPDDPSPS